MRGRKNVPEKAVPARARALMRVVECMVAVGRDSCFDFE